MSCSIISSNLQFYLRSLLRENHNCRMLVIAMFEGSWLNLAAISMCHRWCYRCCRRTGLQKHVRNNGNFPLLYLWTALLTVCTIDSNTVARFVIMCLFLSTKLGGRPSFRLYFSAAVSCDQEKSISRTHRNTVY